MARRRPLAGLGLRSRPGPTRPGPARRFDPGQTAVVRQHRGGRFRAVTPTTVVADEPDRVLLYVPHGTTFLAPADAAGRVTRRIAREAGVTPDRWRDHAALHIVPDGAPFAVMARWGRSWDDFTGYYVNVQEPLRRTAIGFDTMDQTLDLIVDPDLTTWSLKDHQELVDATRAGFFTADEAAAIEAIVDTAVELVADHRPPFDEEWAAWRPDPAWPAPELPAGWEEEPLRAGPWER